MSLSVYYYTQEDARILSPTARPASTPCNLQYLNEGGANVVFRILGVNGKNLPRQLDGKLLRLRKNLPHVESAAQQSQALRENFSGLFPSRNMVRHELIRLEEGLADTLNTLLRKIDRHDHRQNDFLPTDEPYGMLVTDMTPQAGEKLLQLKPKWLVQSPNAPANSTRCRTCALRARRASKGRRTATDHQEICPLDLMSTSESGRLRAARNLSDDAEIAEFLSSDAQPLLFALRDQQAKLDPRGVLAGKGEEQIRGLCRAMTLRDCTLFVKRTRDGVEGRVGDLDLKLPERLHKWRDAECDLINEGWYENEEHQMHWKLETTCALSR